MLAALVLPSPRSSLDRPRFEKEGALFLSLTELSIMERMLCLGRRFERALDILDGMMMMMLLLLLILIMVSPLQLLLIVIDYSNS